MANFTHDTQELLDIVDHHNIIIGQASRHEVHKNNLMHRASHVLIKYHDYVFLQLRAADKSQFPNLWDVSAAGHVTCGDNYLDTAIKELQEELNYIVDPQQLIEYSVLPATEDNGFEFIKLYYVDLDTMPTLTLAEREISTGGWFQINHITAWVTRQPKNFAGCFVLIWQQFLCVLSKK